MDAIVVACEFAIALVMVFAQIKLFSIDSTLKEIRDELRRANGEARENIADENFTKLGI